MPTRMDNTSTLVGEPLYIFQHMFFKQLFLPLKRMRLKVGTRNQNPEKTFPEQEGLSKNELLQGIFHQQS